MRTEWKPAAAVTARPPRLRRSSGGNVVAKIAYGRAVIVGFAYRTRAPVCQREPLFECYCGTTSRLVSCHSGS